MRESLIHGLSDFIRSVPGQVLLQGIAEHTAARTLGPLCQTLRTFENIVGYGYRGFHTLSITTNGGACKRV